MLLCFASLALSITFDYVCKAPLLSADPIKDGVLERMVVLTRHGCRAPFDGYGDYKPQGWNCDTNDSIAPRMSSSEIEYRRYHTKFEIDRIVYQPSCRNADLTIDGQNFHHGLGSFYRSLLIDKYHLLPSDFDETKVFFRSSEPDRCVKSAQSFIHGLYPPSGANEMITLVTGTDKYELLHPRPDHCEDFGAVHRDWVSSDEYQSLKAEAQTKFGWLVNASGLPWDDNQWLWLGDWLYTVGCCGSPLPTVLDQEAFDFAIKALEFFTLDLFTRKRGVAGASILREIFKIFDEGMSGKSSAVFALLSGHDVSIVSLLDIFGYKIDKIPPFGSHLAVEMWKIGTERYLRPVYNGRIVGNGTGLLQYTKFRRDVSPYINFCPELG